MNSSILTPPPLTGNILYVDSIYGSDSHDGQFGSAFLTLGAAKAAASSGDLIWVRPGSYTVTDSILKNGVNWYFDEGASVGKTDTSGAVGIIDDKNTAITSIIGGYGVFTMTFLSATAQGTVTSYNTASNITVQCRSIAANQTDPSGQGVPCAIYNNGGTVRVKAIESISATDTAIDFGTTIYWQQGLTIIEAQSIWSTNNVVNWVRDGSTSDNMYVSCREMYSTGASNGTPGLIYSSSGNNSVAAVWITADTIKANAGSDNCLISMTTSPSKLYVQAIKVFGDTRCGSGLVYVNSEKIEALSNVTGNVSALFFTASGGTLRWNVQQHDPKAFTGIGFLTSGGTVISNEVEYTSGSGSDGLSISSGTARMRLSYINTSANNTANAAKISGGTMIFDNSTLVVEGASDSITAGTAQTVLCYGSYTNRAVNSNVTVTGLLTVNSAVV